jgi:hypothetical protein
VNYCLYSLEGAKEYCGHCCCNEADKPGGVDHVRESAA